MGPAQSTPAHRRDKPARRDHNTNPISSYRGCAHDRENYRLMSYEMDLSKKIAYLQLILVEQQSTRSLVPNEKGMPFSFVKLHTNHFHDLRLQVSGAFPAAY